MKEMDYNSWIRKYGKPIIYIKAKDMNKKSNQLPDGIYLVQEDGSKVPFTGRNNDQERKGCKYIGLKLGSKAICIALRDAAEEYTPLTSGEDTTLVNVTYGK